MKIHKTKQMIGMKLGNLTTNPDTRIRRRKYHLMLMFDISINWHDVRDKAAVSTNLRAYRRVKGIYFSIFRGGGGSTKFPDILKITVCENEINMNHYSTSVYAVNENFLFDPRMSVLRGKPIHNIVCVIFLSLNVWNKDTLKIKVFEF